MHEKNPEDSKKAYKRIQIIQYIFIVAVIGLYVGSIMMLKRGVPYLEAAVSDIRDLNDDLLLTLVEGQSVAGGTGEAIRNLHDPMEDMRNFTIFPEYCADETAVSTYKLQSSIGDIVDYMGGVQDFIDRYKLEGLEGNLDVMVNRAHMLEDALATYISFDWIAKMYVVVICIISFFLFCHTLTSWCRFVGSPAITYLMSYFFLPVFIIIVTAGWCIATAFAVGSVMNSGT